MNTKCKQKTEENSCYLLIVSRFGVQTKQKPIAREKAKLLERKQKKKQMVHVKIFTRKKTLANVIFEIKQTRQM